MSLFSRFIKTAAGPMGRTIGGLLFALLVGFLLIKASLPTAVPGEPLSNRQLLVLIDAAIDRVRSLEVRTDRYTPWEVMHAMIPFGKSLEIYDAEQKQKVNGVRWLLERATFDGEPIFRPVQGGIASWYSGHKFEVQDHPDQYLCKLARAGVALDETVIVDGRKYTMADMVNASKLAIKPGQEVSWSLTAFVLYLGPDAKWKNAAGMAFDIPTVLKMEVAADPTQGTCGGTHGLFSLAHAVNRMRAAGRKLDGPWQEAIQKVERYKRIALAWQDETGYFSGSFFQRPAPPSSDAYLLFSTGHTLEFLALACTDAEIGGVKMRRAAKLIARKLIENLDKDLRKGTLYHAANGLLLYRQRLAGKTG